MSIDIETHTTQYGKNLQAAMDVALTKHVPELERFRDNKAQQKIECKLMMLTFQQEMFRLEKENNNAPL